MKTASGFCLIPWFGVFIDSKSTGPCCVNYNLSNTTSVESYLKSIELNNIKKEFLESKKPKSCEVCWKSESIGVKSIRQEKSEILLKETKFNLKTYFHFSIRISNKCNYKCRMCSPKFSSAWQLDTKASLLRDGKILNIDLFDFNSYKKNIQYITNIAKKQVINVNILGGEPLISNEFLYLLEKSKELDVRKNIILNINTNLSVNKYNNIDYKKEFSTFKAVVLHASIDGINKVGEYIRKGFKQNIFNNNLKYFKDYVKHLNITLQVYNIYDMPNIYNYAKDNKINIIINHLNEPSYLSVSILDKKERENILNYYKNHDFHNKDIEASLINETINTNDIKNFIEYTDNLDSLWKIDIKKNIPELNSWYERIKNEKYNMV
jgi:MoaA/NifB/PqqE/SkfB family radical SAM enzyme